MGVYHDSEVLNVAILREELSDMLFFADLRDVTQIKGSEFWALAKI